MSQAKADLLAVCDEFTRIAGCTDSALSNRMLGAGGRLTRLREGAEITTGRQERAMQWLSDNWPKGATWPKGVARRRVAKLKA